MAVTDEQVATLRAQLAGQVEEHRQLLDHLDPDAARKGYTALIAAAFSLAVERRFNSASDVGIIQFVSDVRSRAPELAERLDPRTAERIVRAAMSDEDINDINTETLYRAQLILLGGLIGDEHLDANGVDRVVSEARKLADEWLA